MTTLAKLSDKLDDLRDDTRAGLESCRVEIAALRGEVRTLGVAQREHDRLDTERFATLTSDVRELRTGLRGVEDTTRTHAVDVARAEATLALRGEQATVDAARGHDWRKSAAIAVFAAILSIAGTLLLKGI